MLDGMIVTVVVASAVFYLVWMVVPRKGRKPAPCAACPRSESHHQAIPVKTRWNS
jgi:hypothetical protein